MSAIEPTTDLVQVKQVSSSLEKIKELLPSIQKGNAIGLNFLKEIQEAKISTKEEREAMVEKLTTVKKIYDKVKKMRTEITEPLDAAKTWIMDFERDMDYSSKSDNSYNKAKKVITDYDQKVLEDNKKAEQVAERKRQTSIYKSELKEKVARQLVEMVAGQVKNVIDGMSKWEASLTLGTIDQEEQVLKSKKPSLKMPSYEACFKTDFVGKALVTEEELQLWYEEWKKEMPYTKYNEEYLQQIAPILNEYRSKMQDIKKQLELIEKASEEKKAGLEKKRAADLEAKSQEAIAEVDKQVEAKVDQLQMATENAKVEADFTKQGQLEGLESGPIKYAVTFENAAWVQPFIAVVGHCIKSDKFKLLNTKEEPIDAISWWMNFFAANCVGTEVNGIKWNEMAKTIIKKK